MLVHFRLEFWQVFIIGVLVFASAIHAFKTGRFPSFYIALVFVGIEAVLRQVCSTIADSARHFRLFIPSTFQQVRKEIEGTGENA